METPTPVPDVPYGLVEQLVRDREPCPARVAAGLRRAAGGPPSATELADAVVAEGRPLLRTA
jgi:hypothetical protein